MGTRARRAGLSTSRRYPTAEGTLAHAVGRPQDIAGFLGADVMRRGVTFEIEVRRGGRRDIAGEEGDRADNSLDGQARRAGNKPPFPPAGLCGKADRGQKTSRRCCRYFEIPASGGPAYATVGTRRRPAPGCYAVRCVTATGPVRITTSE